ncbi:serine/threonine-protein kinase HipA [Glaciihabitans tibetensis]|uniref:Serine/threonine-protein kinase HipA n=1 Tax=Glaciihabitans tibetensis TaxID=1266600 RepID=A0A2T0VCH1_9MICO|nr:HipA domain-containing protein [Glaciihabitans tibetensis]PRY67870.1 serine/threonine-protein kinase HipA [Glaciihabitans tibetensis]
MTDALAVFLHDDFLGEVTPYRRAKNDKSRISFDWGSSYAPGEITLTESFAAIPGVTPNASLVSNFFGGYTPDGNQRVAMAKHRGIDPDDLFAVLREFGGSLGGALTFRDPAEPANYTPSYRLLDDDSVSKRLRQAIEKHDLGVQDDGRSMIPGFQPKLLLARFDGDWYEPHGRAHSTHILKPQLPSRPGNIYNEFYSHELARHMGLSHFASEIATAGQTTFLAIERFDRKVDNHAVSLVHQEDAAQALGLDWKDSAVKFQDPDRPNLRSRPSAFRIAELTGSLPESSAATTRWLEQLVFHVLVGNNDAHAKNVAFLHTTAGTTISELYDAVPNFFQSGRIDWSLAMAVDGIFDHRRISTERLVAEATSWSVLGRSAIESTVESTIRAFREAQAATTALAQTDPGVVERLDWNAARLAAGDEISQPKERATP